MSREINARILKITGGAYLDSKIDPDMALVIKNGVCTIYSTERRDNQDGTYDIVYKGKFTEAIDFEQGGKAIRGRDKTSESKKTRYAVKLFAQETTSEDPEVFYQIFQQRLRENISEVWEILRKK